MARTYSPSSGTPRRRPAPYLIMTGKLHHHFADLLAAAVPSLASTRLDRPGDVLNLGLKRRDWGLYTRDRYTI